MMKTSVSNYIPTFYARNGAAGRREWLSHEIVYIYMHTEKRDETSKGSLANTIDKILSALTRT